MNRNGCSTMALAGTLALAAISLPTHAASYDILIGASGRQLTTSFFAHGALPPGGGFATDFASGQNLYPTDFGDFGGGPRATNDPGFQSFAGTLDPGAIVSIQGIGSLEYWAPATQAWSAPAGGELLRLHGAVPTDIALAYTFCQSGGPLCDRALAEQYPFYAAGTVFSASGISGPNPAIVDDADSQGAFHAHLDWFIENPGGTPAPGAYLVTFAIVADGYQASEPVKVLFNYGLTEAQYLLAFDSRVQPVPEPPAVGLMLAGLGFLMLWLRRRAPAAGIA
ncbi:PEP-CTERM sorting domain-containing protein [Nitrosovibrio sp. Nv17]|uniref:PEP-CTERM sorting domain-containing protein n=1 Tax=Nitrosovibrio sp. Nv17 TaxID=1855339 RepID=UPI000908A553|nr:PEP-CTERM sorting domain-containing protein [Nitrosovibrio sp. Nv17]SFW32550.1 PEP-CTERM protein-sorting domain-containing protein [Nitrosovibrio sp. Nv17]